MTIAIPSMTSAQRARFDPLLRYVDHVINQRELYTAAQCNERAKLLKLNDFDAFIDIIDEMAQRKFD